MDCDQYSDSWYQREGFPRLTALEQRKRIILDDLFSAGVIHERPMGMSFDDNCLLRELDHSGRAIRRDEYRRLHKLWKRWKIKP